MSKKRVSAKKEKEKESYGKVITVFILAIAAVAYLMIIYKLYSRADTLVGTYNFLIIMTWVGVAGTVFGIVWAAVSNMRKEKAGRSRINGVFIAVIFALIGICDWLMSVYYLDAIQVLWVVVPAIAVLYLIYCCYQQEFFIIALLSGISIFLLWFLSKTDFTGIAARLGWIVGTQGNSFWLPYQVTAFIVGYAVIIVCFVFTKIAGKQKGGLNFGDKSIGFLTPKAEYTTLFISYAVMAAVLLAALIGGSVGAYYAMIAAIAYLFIMAVYHTVKMM